MDSGELLPVEMWEMVFDNLDTHKDLLPAYNTCQLWKSILTKKRIEWMFPSIPRLMEYLSKEDILNCRQVCRRWKRAIDSYLESDQPSINSVGYPKTGDHNPQRCLQVNINASAERQHKSMLETLQSFQTQFTAQHVQSDGGGGGIINPFISRSLELTIQTPSLEVLEFFEKLGAHLWSLKLLIIQHRTEDVVSCVTLFEFIWNVLKFAPNLRKLILAEFHTVQSFHTVLTNKEHEEELIGAKYFLESNSVPILPQLNNLRLVVHNPQFRKFLESAYAPQLTKFVLSSADDTVPNNFSKLTDLVWNYEIGKPVRCLDAFRKFNSPSLQRLFISISQHGFVDYREERVWKEVEAFKNSLTYLSICWRCREPIFPTQLDLPFVKEVYLELDFHVNYKIVTNFSFLATFKSLRKLKCIFWNCLSLKLLLLREFKKSNRLEKGVDVLYQLYFEGKCEPLYDSNIWGLVPTLASIEIQVVDEKRKSSAMYYRQ